MIGSNRAAPAGWIPPQPAGGSPQLPGGHGAAPQPQPKSKKSWGLVVAALAVGLVAGVGIGSSGASADTTAPAVTPTVTVTETITAEPADPVTVAADPVTVAAEPATVQVTVIETVTATPEVQEVAVAPGAAAASFGNGVHEVGVDIEPGEYRNTGDGSLCYWARLSGFSGAFDDIIANDLPSGPARVTISESDKGFESSGCGTWTKVG